MFGILDNLARAAIGVVTLPLEVASDVVTMGGAMTDQSEPYTSKRLKQIGENLEKAVTGDGGSAF